MILCPWISTRTHKLNSDSSISIIYNAENRFYYILKGVASNLWALIVKYQGTSQAELFAEKNHYQDELNSLLYELKMNRIINISKTIRKGSVNYLSKPINFENPNYKFFNYNWTNTVYKLGYINLLYLELNYKCNLNCKHCYNHKRMNEYFISFEQAKTIIDEAYDLGISSVTLTGGEPTLNKDFLKICKYIRSKYLELHVNTNGQIMNDDDNLFREISNLYPSCIKISLYSMDSEVHDNITGIKGSWEKTVNVIKKLKNTGVYTTIATPVLSYNKDSYKEVKKFADKLGIWSGTHCVFINNPENNNLSSKLFYNDMEQYYIDKIENSKDITHKYFEKDDAPICEAGYDRVCVNPKLDVFPCVAVEYILGNLNTVSLTKIKSTTLNDFRKKFVRKNLKECFNEEYCKYCFYCSDTACFNNTFLKKQTILCENAKAYYNAILYYKEGKINEKSGKI